MNQAQKIRHEAIAFRNRLSQEQHQHYDQMICERILTSQEYRKADLIFMYMAYRNEVDLAIVMDHAFNHQKKIAVPRVVSDDLVFHTIRSVDELITGYHSIKEPTEIMPVIHETPDLILVPGVAFDRTGNRMGYGKGFYDRFLSKHSGCYKMAVAYEGQFTASIEAKEYDVKMDSIITEHERIYCSEGK